MHRGSKQPLGQNLELVGIHAVIQPLVVWHSYGILKDKWASRAFHGVCLTALWHIWNWRNNVSHATSAEERSAYCNEDIFPVIQRISLLWVSNRASKYRVTCNQWIQSPADMRPP
ncbi:hypothetical protein Tco_1451573 [Tanacetum coccineum]